MSKRNEVYKMSSLPYSFNYKIVKMFYGKNCPICNCTMQRTYYKDLGFSTNLRIPSIQHNLPISKGGLHELDNISIICKHCNITVKNIETSKLNSDEVKELWLKSIIG